MLRNNQTQEVTYLPVGGLFFAIGEANCPPVFTLKGAEACRDRAFKPACPTAVPLGSLLMHRPALRSRCCQSVLALQPITSPTTAPSCAP